ncbi:MAG TPA: HNH endonuclease domain-containing protein [Bacteroidia bacterium]|jgi:CRISPR-associated endonuclease Csn1|nr:HNH endonuclease domain-containing protein [Bacteroidia bacterium]
MGKILGLDLGTNSIGWAIVGNKNENHSLIDKGVHIFSEGVKIDKGKESSKAAERTIFRSARRIKFRRKLRKINTLRVLIENGLCPLAIGELDKWKQDKKSYPQNPEFLKWLSTDEDTGINPYYFRDRASREKIPLNDLGRAFYHLAQRRGFLSNRLDQGDDGLVSQIRKELLRSVEVEDNSDELLAMLDITIKNYEEEDDKAVRKFLKGFEKLIKANNTKPFEELKGTLHNFLNKKENLGAVKKGIAELSQKIKDGGYETLGQYFYHCYQNHQKIRTHYTDREEHYLNEFRRICEVQKLPEEICKALENAIFYQRPLKSQKGLVGKCSFEKTKPRCPVSHPLFEEYRALQFINSIKASNEKGELVFLTADERKSIWPKFIRKSKPSFDFEDIAKELTPKGQHRTFNYKNNTAVAGCPTIAQFVNIFSEGWRESIYEKYTNKKIKKGPKSVEGVINDIWHVLFTYNKDEKLQEFAEQKLGLDKSRAKKFSGITLKKEYGSLSLKAIRKILPYLHEGLIYSYAVFLANIEEVVGKEVWSSVENQKIIRDALKGLIDEFNEIQRLERIVNDLIADFKNEYNNSDSEYRLDEQDKKAVREKVISVYGQKLFAELSVEKQDEVIRWVEDTFVKQLRKYRGEYIKSKRLDEKIATFIQDNFNVSDDNLKRLYHPSDIEKFKVPERSSDGKLYLGSPVVSSIKNPMAMRTMHQLRHLVNTLIREDVIDEETKIHIELARELNDANKRKAIQDWQKERQEKRTEYVEEIKNLYKAQTGKDIEPSEDEVLKFQLWNEQNRICLYTGKSIDICDFIGGNPNFDIEHTIPKSLSFDNSQENLTLCDIRFNREEKRNRIPSELSNHKEILPRLTKWEKEIEGYEILFNSRKKARSTETKEQKDRRIRDKHYFKLHLDYWRGKYNRFTRQDVPEGFKNSQLVDTGIITKYARAYLKSVFGKVYSVKGSMTAEFRKLWGLQSEYESKARANHIHHCIDAITIACMTKSKYDMLAKLYRADEEGFYKEKKEALQIIKPWATYTEDVKGIENEILVSHFTADNIKKNTKKILRKRGKVQYAKDGNPIYKNGDTARGSLHKDKLYGGIKRPLRDENNLIQRDEKGNMLFEKDKDGTDRIFYVIRKIVDPSAGLDLLGEGDVENIVDDIVKDKIKAAITQKGFKKAMSEPIWMNEEKQIRIRKARCFALAVKSPIMLKQHRDLSKHTHKQHIHVVNEDNYGMAIYEGSKGGKIQREGSIINLLHAASYYKRSNSEHREQYPIIESKNKDGLALKTIITKGKMVLLWEHNPLEIWDLDESKRLERLYEVVQIDLEASGIKLLYHQEARQGTEITKFMGLKTGQKGGKNIGKHKEFPYIKVSPNNFDALVEGIDFSFSITGRIQKIG